jgi:L-alanine-DL-glutamate epimerase-like enolase superfamily enzyme
MRLVFRPYNLQFLHPFGVSSNTRTETQTFFVKITRGEISGYGEACLPAYLGGSEQGITASLEKAAMVLRDLPDNVNLRSALSQIVSVIPGDNTALAAIDIALHDLFSRSEAIPVYQMLGLSRPEPKATSFTIAIDAADKLKQKIIEADDYSILKIKAGTRDDKKLIREIRRFTYKPLYVDVNQGWRDKHMVLDMIGWMKEQNVLLVEQPMPVNMYDEMAWVTEKSPLPTIADESARVPSDLDNIHGVFSGINLKLMKCGGIKPGVEMIQKARALGMKVMLGCMAESSCGVAAMSQLLQYADFVDLDAPLLYRNDPFSGINYQFGKISPGKEPGLGISPDTRLQF